MKMKNNSIMSELKDILVLEGFTASYLPVSTANPSELIYISTELESHPNKEFGLVMHQLSALNDDLEGVSLFQLYIEIFNNTIMKQDNWTEVIYAANLLNTKLTIGAFCVNLKNRSVFFKYIVPVSIEREDVDFSEIIQSVWLSTYLCNNFYLVFNDIITKNMSTKTAIAKNNLLNIYSDMF